jgi:hypothetical protein
MEVKMKHYFNYELAKKLCGWVHGPRLDTIPVIDVIADGRKIQITWEYHLMDEHGYYCGYWRFIVKIPVDNPMGFTLNGRAGNPRRSYTEDTKEYLGDMFAEFIPEILREAGIGCELVNEKIYPGDPDYRADMPFAKEHGYHFGRAHYEYSGILAEAGYV